MSMDRYEISLSFVLSANGIVQDKILIDYYSFGFEILGYFFFFYLECTRMDFIHSFFFLLYHHKGYGQVL